MAYTTAAKALYLAGVTSSAVEGTTTAIAQFISWADALIEQKTGKVYSTPSAKTDYFDLSENVYQQDWLREQGRAHYNYNYPEGRDKVVLTYSPVTSITSVMVLYEQSSFDYVTNPAGTEVTSEINSVRGTPVTFDGGTDANALTFVSPYPIHGVNIDLHTNGVSGVLSWVYLDSDGNETAFSNVSESESGADDMTASGKVSWDMPPDWDEYTSGSYTGYYFKAKVNSTVFTTDPAINHIYSVDPVESFISPGTIVWKSNGSLLLRSNWLASGMRNLRVDYKAGATSVPTVVEELSSNLVAQKILENLMGASFDSLTSGSVGEEQWATGEQYMSQLRTLTELRKDEERLWKMLGDDLYVGGM